MLLQLKKWNFLNRKKKEKKEGGEVESHKENYDKNLCCIKYL